ncbi:putative NOT transcription complex subunit VIP2 [Bienertia sinuspersici]
MNDQFNMSNLLNSSMNGPSSNFTDNAGRSFPSPYSVQSGGATPGFHHPNGNYQGMQNMHGSFNIPNMAGAHPARNSTMNVAPSAGMQQSTGNHLAGRYGSNNLPVVLSQITPGNSHGHSGVTNRGAMNSMGNPVYNSSANSVGGSIPGVLQTSAVIGNRGAVPGIGASPFLGNAGSQITSSMGNVVGSGTGYAGRNSGGALSMPGLGSRLDLSSNSGSGNLGLQANRLMSGGPQQQASQHVISMLGNSYASGGGSLSQSHAQSLNNLNSMAMLNDVNSNDKSPFGVDDFPLLSSRPNSAGGAHGQIGGNSDYSMDFFQKDQLRDSNVSMMQTQHFSMGRSAGITGGVYPSSRSQHQQNMPSISGGSDSFVPVNHQGRPHLQGSDMFPSSNSMYHVQHNGHSDNGMRSMNNISAMSSYDQQMQQYQQQNPSSFHLRQMSAIDPSFRDQGVNSIQATHDIDPSYREQGINSIQAIDPKFHDQGVNSIQAINPSIRGQRVNSIQATHAAPDPYSMLGLLSVIRKNNPNLTPLALGIDLTSLGLNLSSSEDLHKKFGSPWSDRCVEENPDYRRGWFYHKELHTWLTRFPNEEPPIKTPVYERGSYLSFDPHTWETKAKDNFVLQYDMVEKRPILQQH